MGRDSLFAILTVLIFIFSQNSYSKPSNNIWSLDYSYIKSGPAGACGINKANKVECWGMGEQNWIGLKYVPYLINKDHEINSEKNMVEVHLSRNGICTLLSDNKVKCFDNTTLESINGSSKKFLQFSIWGEKVCGITDNFKVFCWGKTDNGFKYIPDWGEYIQVSVADKHACVVLKSGSMACWGEVLPYHPWKINLLNPNYRWIDHQNIKSVDTSNSHTCILRKDDTLSCWNNENGRFISGFENLKNVRQVSLNKSDSLKTRIDSYFICGIGTDDSVFCMNETSRKSYVPNGIGKPEQISVDGGKACLLNSNANVTCWGRSQGNGESISPKDLKNIKSITVAFSKEAPFSFLSLKEITEQKICFQYLDDRIKCTGEAQGFWRRGSFENYSPYGYYHDLLFSNTPPVSENINFVRLGNRMGAGITKDNSVFYWGFQLLERRRGRYSSLSSRDFEHLPDHRSYLDISLGWNHFCALMKNGKMECRGVVSSWPDFSYNKYFDKSVSSKLTNVVAITSFPDKSCALDSDNVITCFGQISLEEKIGFPANIGVPESIFYDPHSQFPCVYTKQRKVYCTKNGSYTLVADKVTRVSSGFYVTILHRENELDSLVLLGRFSNNVYKPRPSPQRMGKIKNLIVGRFDGRGEFFVYCGISEKNEFGCW